MKPVPFNLAFLVSWVPGFLIDSSSRCPRALEGDEDSSSAKSAGELAVNFEDARKQNLQNEARSVDVV